MVKATSEPFGPMAAVDGSEREKVRLRQRLGAHVEACRPDLLAYAGLVGVAGAILASPEPTLWRVAGAWLAPTLGWVAAMYGGDYFDRELDAIAKPHRPIPSGRISARTAFACFIGSAALGAVIAVMLNPLNAVVVAITLALGVSYSRFLKARGVWGNLVRGGVTAMAFVMGTLATSPTLPIELLPIALVFWLHDTGSNVVGTICDRDGDRAGGYLTVPVRYGDAVALRLMFVFDALWLAVALAVPVVVGDRFDLASYGAFLAVAVAMGAVTAAMLVRAPRPIPRPDAVRAHQVLVIERLVLVCAFVGAATTVGLALVLLVPSIAATILTSRALARRHDRQAHAPRGTT